MELGGCWMKVAEVVGGEEEEDGDCHRDEGEGGWLW